MRVALSSLSFACLLAAGPLCAAPPTQVMIVGTYHFSNPGHDQHNVASDDVLEPQKQRQLEAIDRALAKFHPTRVAVEWPKDLADERYGKFLHGELAPSHNEVVQLGFRVAKSAGLARVEGVDVDGDFPYEPVAAFAQAHGMTPQLTDAQDAIQAMVEKVTALQKQGIAVALREMNRPEAIAKDFSFYGNLLRYGAGDEQPGAALLAAWTKRNLEICARLVQTIQAGDHVVVFYGSGHAYLLRQCVREVPGLALVEANDYLPK